MMWGCGEDFHAYRDVHSRSRCSHWFDIEWQQRSTFWFLVQMAANGAEWLRLLVEYTPLQRQQRQDKGRYLSGRGSGEPDSESQRTAVATRAWLPHATNTGK